MWQLHYAQNDTKFERCLTDLRQKLEVERKASMRLGSERDLLRSRMVNIEERLHKEDTNSDQQHSGKDFGLKMGE